MSAVVPDGIVCFFTSYQYMVRLYSVVVIFISCLLNLGNDVTLQFTANLFEGFNRNRIQS